MAPKNQPEPARFWRLPAHQREMTRVDSETMVIEDIIVFEYMFSDIEITSFDLFLDSGDIFREHF